MLTCGRADGYLRKVNEENEDKHKYDCGSDGCKDLVHVAAECPLYDEEGEEGDV